MTILIRICFILSMHMELSGKKLFKKDTPFELLPKLLEFDLSLPSSLSFVGFQLRLSLPSV